METTEDIHVQFRFTIEDARKAFRWFWRAQAPRWRQIVPTIVGLAMIVLGVGLLVSGVREPFAGILALWIGILTFSVPGIRRWASIRTFKKSSVVDMEFAWTFSPERIVAKGPHSTSELTWPAFVKVASTPDGVLLLTTSQIFHWLPRQAFRDDAEFQRLTDLARAKAKDFRQLL